MAEPVAGPSTVAQLEPTDVVVAKWLLLMRIQPIIGEATLQRHLNIMDALNFIDVVKAQFPHRPDVYNSFLDIMKDFQYQL